MKNFLDRILKGKAVKSSKKVNETNRNVDFKVDAVRFELRAKFLELQKQHLREKIVAELASLKDEVNVEAILADLGEKYILRPDFSSVSLQSNYDQDPMLLLSFVSENSANRERIDHFVPLARYLVA